jgi:hypothetical protein
MESQADQVNLSRNGTESACQTDETVTQQRSKAAYAAKDCEYQLVIGLHERQSGR